MTGLTANGIVTAGQGVTTGRCQATTTGSTGSHNPAAK